MGHTYTKQSLLVIWKFKLNSASCVLLDNTSWDFIENLIKFVFNLGEWINVQILLEGILVRLYSFIHIAPELLLLHLSLAII